MFHTVSVWLLSYGTWSFMFTPLIVIVVGQQKGIQREMRKCPKAFTDRIAALLAAESIGRKSRGKQEPTPYSCDVCKKWHLKEGK